MGVIASANCAWLFRHAPADPRTARARRDTVEFTAGARPDTAVETAVLLRLAEAVHERRPIAIGYTDRNRRPGERTVYPYGLVDHYGRWYLTGKDCNSDELRQFRRDRITAVTTLPGTFTPPAGFEPAVHLLSALATAPFRHQVSIRGQGTLTQVRPLLPETIAAVHELDSLSPDSRAWVGARQSRRPPRFGATGMAEGFLRRTRT
ncbi:helix-turn-helix transcriptional regulator [Nocardia sp. NPDC059246]|uniref:helix-turn-helix transcriptional regulator n=1 Tax=unclassified Nocardia TaxID=2637762 RepID=UPI00369AD17D